jgi:hypothetical protein
MMEHKPFQDTPNIQLALELYRLGMRAKEEFGEIALGEYLIMQAKTYKTGEWQMQMQKILDIIDQQQEEELLKKVDFDKLPLQ